MKFVSQGGVSWTNRIIIVWNWYAAKFSILDDKNELKIKYKKVKTRTNALGARKDLKQKIQTAGDASRAPQPLTWDVKWLRCLQHVINAQYSRMPE